MLRIEKFECQKCGECCKNSIIPVYYSDVQRWEKERRWDILMRITFVEWQNHEGLKNRGFVFPETVPENGVCPFLSDENLCLIHDTKPKTCRNFPLNRATQERLAKCNGIGKGKKVDPKIIELNFSDEQQDLAEMLNRGKKVVAKLILAKQLYSQIKRGLIVYDKSLGKYKFTIKGIKQFKKDAEKLLQEAIKTGKTIEQIAMERFSELTKPQEYKKKR